MANVIVCCDGTWNTADQKDGGVPCPTNVAKIHNAIAESGENDVKQIKYYHPGVGTDGGKLDRVLDGATGDGLDKNIKSAYKWLAQNYHPDDKIFICGFSRGAYTARYVAGMVCSYGLADFSSVTPSDDQMWAWVDRIYDADRKSADPSTLADIPFFNTPAGESGTDRTPIHFLGVWDTVGSLGIPDDLALLNLIDSVENNQFQDTALSDTVLHARHAIAMDERRQSFTPTLWQNAAKHADAKQIWFAGVHSDVGGGYVQTGLSDITLQWMIEEAKAQGLCFRPGIDAQIHPDPRGVLHDSAVGVFAALKTLPRSAPLVADTGVAASKLHKSVVDRGRNPPIAQTPYWNTHVLQPGESIAVDVFALQHWNETGVYLEKGAEYSFEATGQWIDGDIKCDPAGGTDGRFHLGAVAQTAASALGQAEQLYRKLTKNEQADFWWTKRLEQYAWFALVGVIANGIGTDENGNPAPHETFLIGNGRDAYRPAESGYLYCFANDAWHAYKNNRGSVRLVIRRN